MSTHTKQPHQKNQQSFQPEALASSRQPKRRPAFPKHIVKRRSIFYFRLVVPVDLRDHYPYTELKRSLKTGDLEAAKVLARVYEGELQMQFALLRANGIGAVSPALVHTSGQQQQSQPVVSMSNFSQGRKTTADKTTSMNVQKAFEEFVAEKKAQWTENTLLEFTSILATFEDHFRSNTKLSDVSRTACVAIRDKLAEKRAAKTVNKSMTLLSSFFKWAVRQGLVKRNPAEGLGLKLTKKASEERKAYTPEQLKALFSALPAVDHPEEPSKFWIPRIAAYSGLRLEEICQLKPKDIIEEPGGVLCLNIDGPHLKTSSSKRIVPIHRELLNLGLGNYLQGLPSDQEGWIFPELKEYRSARGKYFSKWFGQFLRKTVCISDKGITFHSLRHTFATALQHSQVEPLVISQLMGHAVKSMTFGRYAKGYPAEVLAEAVDQIDFGGCHQ